MLLNLFDDLQVFPRGNSTPDDAGNRRFDELAIDMRCEVFQDESAKHVLAMEQIPLPVEN